MILPVLRFLLRLELDRLGRRTRVARWQEEGAD